MKLSKISEIREMKISETKLIENPLPSNKYHEKIPKNEKS